MKEPVLCFLEIGHREYFQVGMWTFWVQLVEGHLISHLLPSFLFVSDYPQLLSNTGVVLVHFVLKKLHSLSPLVALITLLPAGSQN